MGGQKRQLLVILVLLAVCAGAFFGLKAYNASQEKKEQKKTEQESVTAVSVKAEDVTGLSWQKDGNTLVFEKQEDTWYYQPDQSIPVDQNGIASMLSAVNRITAADVLKDVADESEYGFDTPQNVLNFHTAEGTYTVTLGMKNEVTGQYYVKNSESQDIYLIDTDLNHTFSKTVEELTAEEDTENTENSGEAQNTGNAEDTENTGNTEDTGNTENTEESGEEGAGE